MNTETGRRLADLRHSRGLSQEELAGRLGVSRQAVSNWERSESQPDTANLVLLAECYGVSLDELVGRELRAGGAEDCGKGRGSGDWIGRRPSLLSDASWLTVCLILSFAYFALVAPPLLQSTVDDLTEVFGLTPSPALAVVWFVSELLFVLVPFVVLAAAPPRVPRWIFVAPAAAFAMPLLVAAGSAALGGAAAVEYSGIGGALTFSVALKADVLALVIGCVLVAISKGRKAAASSNWQAHRAGGER